MKIYDISPKLSPRLAVWPGDKSFARHEALSFKKGDNLVLSSIEGTVHLGAHTDAPNHYHPQGLGMDRRELRPYLGLAQVLSVTIPRGERIQISHLKNRKIEAERVLFATGSYPNPEKFNEDFCSLSPELVEYLAKEKVRLVGIDTPSVDPFSSKALEAHNAIYRHDLAILEGIVLTGVPDGLYFLSALPLSIEGGDASPVRAVLVPKAEITRLS